MASAAGGIQFERPVGAHADVKELEYVSALHQTAVSDLRRDATIEAHDIALYLKSRHGVKVDQEVVFRQIIIELCGSLPPPPTVHRVSNDLVENNNHPSHAPNGAHSQGDPTTQTTNTTTTTTTRTVMDLCQMVSLLLIPFLRSEQVTWQEQELSNSNYYTNTLMEQVLNSLWEDAAAAGVNVERHRDQSTGQVKLNVPLLKELLDVYGEGHVPTSVVRDMIQAAAAAAGSGDVNNKTTGDSGNDHSHDGGEFISEKSDQGEEDVFEDEPSAASQHSGNLASRSCGASTASSSHPSGKSGTSDGPGGMEILLTQRVLMHALTADVELYHPWVETMTTTHREDAVKAQQLHTTTAQQPASKRRPNHYRAMQVTANDHSPETIGTASFIDQSADNHRSVLFLVLLWITLVLAYICYLAVADGFYVKLNFCSVPLASFCQALEGMLHWTIIFAKLSVFGVLFITLASLGNAPRSTETELEWMLKVLGTVLAMAVVGAVTIIPKFSDLQTPVSDFTEKDELKAVYWVTFILGAALLSIQLMRLVGLVCPLQAWSWFSADGGAAQREQQTKQAAFFKVRKMVEHARLLHCEPDVLAVGQPPTVHASIQSARAELTSIPEHKQFMQVSSSSSKAIANFQALQEDTKTTGGVRWTWMRLFSGRLRQEEGIWLSSRLITSNVAQFLVCLLLVGFYFFFLRLYFDGPPEVATLTEPSTVMATMPPATAVPATPRYTPPPVPIRRDLFHGTRKLYIQYYNDTHYSDGFYVYKNPIRDVNATHFTDGVHTWPYNSYSHNGTHVFEKYQYYNKTHITDGHTLFPYSMYSTNGTNLFNESGLFWHPGMEVPVEPVWPFEEWEFKAGLISGMVAGLLFTVGVVVVYIPSYVSTVIKYRSGVLSSLKGVNSIWEFRQHRYTQEDSTMMFGQAFWGCLLTGLVAWFVVGSAVFLAVWSKTRPIALTFLAQVSGMAILFSFKSLLMSCLRCCACYAAFYRPRPAGANHVNVLLECWNSVLSVAYMLVRAIQLLLIAVFYMGRIDTTMLGPGVGYIGPIALDSTPNGFKKDLLMHEAHRHPYIERLGMLYLMKLHHGKEFGNRAGAYWRLLFVLILMPWMRRYRVRSNDPIQKNHDVESPERSDVDTEGNLTSGAQVELEMTRRSNQQLIEKNRALKDEIHRLRAKLKEARGGNLGSSVGSVNFGDSVDKLDARHRDFGIPHSVTEQGRAAELVSSNFPDPGKIHQHNTSGSKSDEHEVDGSDRFSEVDLGEENSDGSEDSEDLESGKGSDDSEPGMKDANSGSESEAESSSQADNNNGDRKQGEGFQDEVFSEEDSNDGDEEEDESDNFEEDPKKHPSLATYMNNPTFVLPSIRTIEEERTVASEVEGLVKDDDVPDDCGDDDDDNNESASLLPGDDKEIV